MTDRELLGLAARAASQQGGWIENESEGWGFWQIPGGGEWNPLTSDGDALRLAVKLKLLIDSDYNGGVAVGSATHDEVFESCGNDPYATTRRAIVRAAAEIGKVIQQPKLEDVPEDNYRKTQA